MSKGALRCTECQTTVWHQLVDATERGVDIITDVEVDEEGAATATVRFEGRKYYRDEGDITCENGHTPSDEFFELITLAEKEWT